ncbi:MATE family efflux transporter [Sulfitobacter geojensis]|uniref:MATE family efflux transporter n=1 Tax=Sulfitobacter geojensis TaxID=1342299 RepID=A0AAE3B5M2_9RHOB|nr:MATE family efflux transporter [Sulfitobacter geojensis]MBM1688818.1 MATE family efflux transporter [Sulfitobacter geojensis]MBM1692885.1 MATE family efflux transporter [Sulfitobacter geojensis]MBM1705051.1 MATE family efflux transporter [Sulfitobacter geojensis]MBM1709109.1 MATE family efflux transporter [Sulfitobacter geojensis]MBM1713174.1 MATE family efflux transporter [Sulfitobacter geojensis]
MVRPASASTTPLDPASRARATRTKALLEAPIGITLATLAAPNILAMFVQAMQSIAEAYFASVLGVTTLAGLALVFPLVMLTQMLSAGAMGGAISASIARALGSGSPQRAASLTLVAWLIATGLAVCMAVFIGVFGKMIFGALSDSPEAIRAASTYAIVFFPGSVAVWLCNCSLSVIRGTGEMQIPSLLLLLVSLISIPLAGGLALGWWGLPRLGIAGLPLGLVVAYGFGALVAIGYILSGRTGLVFAGAFGRINRGMFTDILKVGAMASINALLTVLTIVLMVGLVGQYGEAALAGYGLGARLEFLMIPVIFGIGAAMTSMVGANIGAKNITRALRIAWIGSFSAALIVGSIGFLLAVYPDLWLGMFLDPSDAAALEVGRAYFRIVAPLYPFFGLGLALYFASQGAGIMLWPVIGSLSRIAVAVGCTAALGAMTSLGISGVFIAIALAMFVYGVVIAVAIKVTGWKSRASRSPRS